MSLLFSLLFSLLLLILPLGHDSLAGTMAPIKPCESKLTGSYSLDQIFLFEIAGLERTLGNLQHISVNKAQRLNEKFQNQLKAGRLDTLLPSHNPAAVIRDAIFIQNYLKVKVMAMRIKTLAELYKKLNPREMNEIIRITSDLETHLSAFQSADEIRDWFINNRSIFPLEPSERAIIDFRLKRVRLHSFPNSTMLGLSDLKQWLQQTGWFSIDRQSPVQIDRIKFLWAKIAWPLENDTQTEITKQVSAHLRQLQILVDEESREIPYYGTGEYVTKLRRLHAEFEKATGYLKLFGFSDQVSPILVYKDLPKFDIAATAKTHLPDDAVFNSVTISGSDYAAIAAFTEDLSRAGQFTFFVREIDRLIGLMTSSHIDYLNLIANHPIARVFASPTSPKKTAVEIIQTAQASHLFKKLADQLDAQVSPQ
jgi:hypothetical protein